MAYPSDLVRTKNWGSEVLTDSDLESQYDIIINWVMAALNATTGHSHDGSANNGPKIPITNLTVSSQAQGDTITATSASAWGRIAKGSANQLYQMNAGATSPEWVNYSTFVTAENALSGSVVQFKTSSFGTATDISSVATIDDTKPLYSELTNLSGLDCTITPKSATNRLLIRVTLQWCDNNSGSKVSAALFQDPSAGSECLSAVFGPSLNGAGYDAFQQVLEHEMAAGTTSATTFKVSVANSSSNNSYLHSNSSTTRIFGGAIASRITIMEIKV